jgi:hypothetical protein
VGTGICSGIEGFAAFPKLKLLGDHRDRRVVHREPEPVNLIVELMIAAFPEI